MTLVSDREPRVEVCGAVALPWAERTAAAWALGYPVGIAPEDRAAIEAVAATLVREAVERVCPGGGNG